MCLPCTSRSTWCSSIASTSAPSFRYAETTLISGPMSARSRTRSFSSAKVRTNPYACPLENTLSRTLSHAHTLSHRSHTVSTPQPRSRPQLSCIHSLSLAQLADNTDSVRAGLQAAGSLIGGLVSLLQSICTLHFLRVPPLTLAHAVGVSGSLRGRKSDQCLSYIFIVRASSLTANVFATSHHEEGEE